MDFIESDSICDTKEVSTGRTNTQLRGDTTEFVQLNEKTSNFDVSFRAKNPLLSGEDVQINLYVDIEPQKTYRPGYPLEKRGIYYLPGSSHRNYLLLRIPRTTESWENATVSGYAGTTSRRTSATVSPFAKYVM